MLLAAGWSSVGQEAASAANWPRFRGPNGTGVAADKDIPIRWTEKGGLAWKTAVPGLGNSSPVVWGDRVFLQSASEDGKERRLLCLDAVHGNILWSETASGATAHTHPKNTLASSTPATDGERVYTVFWDGQETTLCAYDFQGKQVWKHDLGVFTSQHGAGASPVVYDGKVFLANDQDGRSHLLAIDAKTGHTAWQVSRRPFRACYTAPFVLDRGDGDPQLVVASTAGVTAYNPRTGAQSWHWTWTFDGMPLRTIGSPLYSQGMIFACSGDGNGSRHMVALRMLADSGATRLELAWENKRYLPYVPTMLIQGEYLYYVNDHGFAGCCVAQTGEHVWRERLAANVTASPVLIDGKVYAVSEEGIVSVFAAAPQFKLLAKNPLGEPVMASPAVADGRLFIRGRNHLFCIAKTTLR
jgi:outer membrane protein assembly factor BamB